MNWKSASDVLRDVFRDWNVEWVRYFLVQNNPMDFIRNFSSADILKRATPFLFHAIALFKTSLTLDLQALPAALMEFGDFRTGLKVMRITGTGNYDNLLHSMLAFRLFVWNKQRNTKFSIGWTDSGGFLAWH